MADFPPLPFEELNEADVREEILAPLLRALGYRSGTDAHVIREQSLRYPRSFLGRKDTAKDPELRGKADYIMEVKRLVRWVIEAKAPSAEIKTDDIEQAWTYANHAEVRAVYFVLCNGKSLQVFQTQHSPTAAPILVVDYDDLSKKLGVIADLLGPEALLRDFPQRVVDEAPPIGPGLRSVVRITSGLISYDRNSLGYTQINELQTTIANGAVERDENDHLIAYLNTVASMRSFQELNERLGLSSFEMTSTDSALSIDPARPTTFTSTRTIVLPAGQPILDIVRWRTIALPQSVSCEVSTTATGVLANRTFFGTFSSRLRYPSLNNLVVDIEGPFIVHVA